MQPTDVQVKQSLAALEAAPLTAGDRVPRTTIEVVLADLPDGLLEGLDATPAVRPDRLEEAKDRLAGGAQPSSGELADRIVGRLVCDRLR